MVSVWLKSCEVHLGGNQVVKNTNKALDRLILLVQQLLLYLQDEGQLLQDGGIKNVVLLMRQGGRENVVKPLTVKWSWMRWRGGGGQ